MVLVDLGPLALRIVQLDLVVDALRIQTADVVQRLSRRLVAHRAHACVEFERGALHRAGRQVDYIGFIAHDVAISSANDRDLS